MTRIYYGELCRDEVLPVLRHGEPVLPLNRKVVDQSFLDAVNKGTAKAPVTFEVSMPSFSPGDSERLVKEIEARLRRLRRKGSVI